MRKMRMCHTICFGCTGGMLVNIFRETLNCEDVLYELFPGDVVGIAGEQ